MSNRDKKSDLKSGAFGALGDIGKILAEALKNRPVLAALVLIVLIAAIVTISCRGKEAIIGFFLLAGFVVMACYLVRGQVHMGKEEIRRLGRMKLDMDTDTTSFVNTLSSDHKQDILKALQGAAKDVSGALSIPFNLVRANLFGVDKNNRMRMLHDLSFNMDRKQELTVSMPVGYGSTGRCFEACKPNIAVFRKGWGKNLI